MMMLNEASHYFFVSIKSVDRSNLIFTHKAAITLDIRTEDGSELAFYFLVVIESSP